MTSILPLSPGLKKSPSNMRFHDPAWREEQGRWLGTRPSLSSGKMHTADTVFLHPSLLYSFLRSLSIEQEVKPTHYPGYWWAFTENLLCARRFGCAGWREIRGLSGGPTLEEHTRLHFADDGTEAWGG